MKSSKLHALFNVACPDAICEQAIRSKSSPYNVESVSFTVRLNLLP